MEMSGQLRAPAVLLPRKEYALDRRLGVFREVGAGVLYII